MSTENNSLCKCYCCEGIKKFTPADVTNLPGLSALHYRIGTHHSFKQSMLTALSANPQLKNLTTRDDDDFSIATIDAWATVSDILSFYQERIINEGYLRTATERLSVLELAKQISYNPAPGVAASTFLAFTINETSGAPTKAVIPSGTKVQSVPEQDQLPQIFETTEELEARVEWNAIKLQTKVSKIPEFGEIEIYLKGISTGLQPGDGILMIGLDRLQDQKNENWDFRRVKEVIPDPNANHTKINWDKGLGKFSNGKKTEPAKKDFKIYALRQRAFLFGHNAPDFKTLSGTIKSEFLLPGLRANYYSGISFDNLVAEITEDNINKNWGSNGPRVGLENNFSVIWSGWILSPVSGEITFYTYSDDGVRLFINNELVINDWNDHSPLERTVTLVLKAGKLYNLLLEYYERAGGAVIQLAWSGPGLSKQVIPPKNFFRHADDNEWPGYTISAISGEENTIHLDAIYSKIVKNSWLVLSAGHYEEVYDVMDTIESLRKNFTLVSKTTKLKLRGEHLREKFDAHVSDTIVFAQSEELEIAEKPLTDSPIGNKITLENILPDLPKEKIIIISGKRKRIKIKAPDGVLTLRSTTGQEEKKLYPGDSLIVMSIPYFFRGIFISIPYLIGTPNVRNNIEPIRGTTETVWTLQDNTGFIGTIRLTNDQFEFTNAEEKDEIVSELHKIKDVQANNIPTVIILEEDLAHYCDPATVRIYANVVNATHGETTVEILGSGDSSKSFQKFELKQKPLTYISAAIAGGTKSTLEIRVNDILWKEVPSLYGISSAKKVYITRIDDNGTVTIQFGDGITGARLPTGTVNVKAKYKKGNGTPGLVNAGTLTMLLTPPLGVNKVHNPLPASGAGDPETLATARKNAPFTVRTFDRIVSLKDFEDYVRTFAGISKARADLLWSGDRQVIYITIASADKQDLDKTSNLYKNLVSSVKNAGHFYNMVYIENYEKVSFSLNARIKVDHLHLFEMVRGDVEKRLKEVFSFEERDFGPDVTVSEILSVIQQVEGVVFVDLESLKVESLKEQKIINADKRFRISSEVARKVGTEIRSAQLVTIDAEKIVITEI